MRRVVARAEVAPGDLVAEIGPGLGALTLALVEAGAKVVAVEVDAGLVRALREVLAGVEQLTLHHADALEVDWATLLGGRPALLVANLPYHLATPMVIGGLESGCFERLEVMVQREVGERWTATAGHPAFSAASLRVAAHAEARIDGRVSRNAFLPVPGVDSVTVRIEPRPWPFDVAREQVLDLVTVGFAQRRKRLRNALRAGGLDTATLDAAFAAAGIGVDARAEEVDLAGWVTLARHLPPATPAG